MKRTISLIVNLHDIIPEVTKHIIESGKTEYDLANVNLEWIDRAEGTVKATLTFKAS
jgi:hypothetical protein